MMEAFYLQLPQSSYQLFGLLEIYHQAIFQLYTFNICFTISCQTHKRIFIIIQATFKFLKQDLYSQRGKQHYDKYYIKFTFIFSNFSISAISYSTLLNFISFVFSLALSSIASAKSVKTISIFLSLNFSTFFSKTLVPHATSKIFIVAFYRVHI